MLKLFKGTEIEKLQASTELLSYVKWLPLVVVLVTIIFSLILFNYLTLFY